MEKTEKTNFEIEKQTQPATSSGDEVEVNYRGIKTMPFIIGNETFEKLGAIGTLSNLLIYLTTVFNMKRISATTLLNVFNGTTNLATLVGAYLSDTYFGRYKTLGFGSIASLLGFLVVNLTAVFKTLHPAPCSPDSAACSGPTPSQMAFLIFGFVLMIIGAGGIRPCNLAFGADQFNPNTDSGKRGIDSFFNWYYFTVTLATLISVTLVVYVQSNISWSIGMAIPVIFMFLSCFLYFIASRMYVKVLPEGSSITSLFQVAVVAVKKRRMKLPERPWVSLFNYTPIRSSNSRLAYTDQFGFLDKAAIITSDDNFHPDGSPSDPWNLCSIQQVEEAKCVLRVIPISLTAIIYHIGVQQQYIVFQALQSDRHLGRSKFQIPPASYVVFAMLTLAVWVPIYDRLIIPYTRRINRGGQGITLLQRLGFGLFIIIVESVVGAVVEKRRRGLAVAKGSTVSPMSALWLVPQLALGGFAEAFYTIGQLEFYYKQFPENMRSVAGAFFFCGSAASSYAYSLLISLVHRLTEKNSSGNWLPEDLNKGRLDSFYYLVGVLCALNFLYFLVCANWYRYKGTEENRNTLKIDSEKLNNHSA